MRVVCGNKGYKARVYYEPHRWSRTTMESKLSVSITALPSACSGKFSLSEISENFLSSSSPPSCWKLAGAMECRPAHLSIPPNSCSNYSTFAEGGKVMFTSPPCVLCAKNHERNMQGRIRMTMPPVGNLKPRASQLALHLPGGSASPLTHTGATSCVGAPWPNMDFRQSGKLESNRPLHPRGSICMCAPTVRRH